MVGPWAAQYRYANISCKINAQAATKFNYQESGFLFSNAEYLTFPTQTKQACVCGSAELPFLPAP
jgi:hypothetical protein